MARFINHLSTRPLHELVKEPQLHYARLAMVQYFARAPLLIEKLTYDRAGGKVLYHTSYNPYFKQNASLWSAPDFIACLTQFIPPWGVRLIHSYWQFSSLRKTLWHCLPQWRGFLPQGSGCFTSSQCLRR